MHKHKMCQTIVTCLTCCGVVVWMIMPDNALAAIAVGSLTNLVWVWFE